MNKLFFFKSSMCSSKFYTASPMHETWCMPIIITNRTLKNGLIKPKFTVSEQLDSQNVRYFNLVKQLKGVIRDYIYLLNTNLIFSRYLKEQSGLRQIKISVPLSSCGTQTVESSTDRLMIENTLIIQVNLKLNLRYIQQNSCNSNFHCVKICNN